MLMEKNYQESRLSHSTPSFSLSSSKNSTFHSYSQFESIATFQALFLLQQPIPIFSTKMYKHYISETTGLKKRRRRRKANNSIGVQLYKIHLKTRGSDPHCNHSNLAHYLPYIIQVWPSGNTLHDQGKMHINKFLDYPYVDIQVFYTSFT